MNNIYKKYFSKKNLHKYTISYIETEFESKLIELSSNNNNILIDYKILSSYDINLNKILLSKDMIIIDKKKLYNTDLTIPSNINNIQEFEKYLFKLFPNKIIYDTINNLRIYFIVEKIIRI
jgi:hypothetical protein